MAGKHLSLGIQDFEDFINHDFIYVDKTKFIYNLITPPKAFYFLSRPRRFGKSLLISTLKYLFEGRSDLFKKLWIGTKSKWEFDTHPVLTFDFNGINHENPKKLRNDLLSLIRSIAKEHKITLPNNSIPLSFKTCITSLKIKYQKTVVILIDEYDKPIISHIGKGENELILAKKNRDILKQFFGVIKEQSVSNALRFVLITGVSKFSQVSIFSDLNNLNDISMQDMYSTLLGYTQYELTHFFKSFIENLKNELKISYTQSLDQLKLWYNGYKFSEEGEKVYNPFSILNVLQTKTFKNYWFGTGTPTFLVNLVNERNYSIPNIENLNVGEQSFTTFDIEQLQIEALLFQTGYITIISYDGFLYRLSYPNQEVKHSFLNFVYQNNVIIPDSNTRDSYSLLHKYLREKKYENFIVTVNAILSSIPYTQLANKDELFYHTVFYLMLGASGVNVQTEVLTSKGRIDIVVFIDDTIYIIELKCNQSADTAIKQIKKKGYADKYKKNGKTIKLIGINFNSKNREISDWKID